MAGKVIARWNIATLLGANMAAQFTNSEIFSLPFFTLSSFSVLPLHPEASSLWIDSP
ncbi:hypothetical protein GXP67_31080 [Rhodocytophaga rosea]|uniref:Uncharacterized protein n=1 Tax=Rhodocytophaga rosea TaxID=2704465 RepID=A0A6C0GDS5_9BACT|nr:hypothetical protein [Rhodocytophaga rosea]QHT66159.1 hypothetical protein GXP67_05490 [Rhodocytophaga rosea]QHT70777.1 hypothetical protein GXP67_31080 [Rhodocytophaga rosea]